MALECVELMSTKQSSSLHICSCSILFFLIETPMEEDLSVHTDEVDGGICHAGTLYSDSGTQMSPSTEVDCILLSGETHTLIKVWPVSARTPKFQSV